MKVSVEFGFDDFLDAAEGTAYEILSKVDSANSQNEFMGMVESKFGGEIPELREILDYVSENGDSILKDLGYFSAGDFVSVRKILNLDDKLKELAKKCKGSLAEKIEELEGYVYDALDSESQSEFDSRKADVALAAMDIKGDSKQSPFYGELKETLDALAEEFGVIR